MNHILVPTDLSPLANAALPVAATLARQYGAEITLLHYVPYNLATPGLTEAPLPIANYIDEQEAEATQALQALCQDPQYADLTIKPMVTTDSKGLYGVMASYPADLIVMASRGATGWTEWLVGSNAEQVIRRVHCPVLVVKEGQPDFAPKRAICAIDVDERLKTHPAWPFHLADGVRQYVYVLTPTDARVPEGIREFMAELAAAQHLTDYEFTFVSSADVPGGILEFAEKQAADLILLFTRQHDGFWHLLSGSVAEDVVNHATVPVLVMPLGDND
ncbi:universal stress protein [Rudanella paleaurantiibacter]|uniref:Universal stress protein n=1 Tax=Rudanella paleaurantiibacter TaxID=2614655 RepID=A0A7J5U058_9BACT|nr:universal stress protein [Rudanella paleaurantiibacter]KAB7730000.1 universal stress protein [Rudanella paleaurantiibacter]